MALLRAVPLLRATDTGSVVFTRYSQWRYVGASNRNAFPDFCEPLPSGGPSMDSDFDFLSEMPEEGSTARRRRSVKATAQPKTARSRSYGRQLNDLVQHIETRLGTDWPREDGVLPVTPGRALRERTVEQLAACFGEDERAAAMPFLLRLERRMHDRYFVLHQQEYLEAARALHRYLPRDVATLLRQDPDVLASMQPSELRNLGKGPPAPTTGPETGCLPGESRVHRPIVSETRCKNHDCGSYDVVTERRMTRSGDEGITTFYRCRTCSKTWRS